MQANTFTLTLEDAFFISKNVKHFIFQADQPVAYQPGQFITLHIPHGEKTLRRSYSIANASFNPKCIEFAAGYVEGGPASELLFNMKKNDVLPTVAGPFGRLLLKTPHLDPNRYIFVATSTGITPYRAMMPELLTRLSTNPNLSILLIQGVQTRDDRLYHDDFLSYATEYPNVQYHVFYSREQDKQLEPYEHHGYVQTGFNAFNLHPEKDLFYLCGNPGMVDESFELLKMKGFTVQNIIREKYISR